MKQWDRALFSISDDNYSFACTSKKTSWSFAADLLCSQVFTVGVCWGLLLRRSLFLSFFWLPQTVHIPVGAGLALGTAGPTPGAAGPALGSAGPTPAPTGPRLTCCCSQGAPRTVATVVAPISFPSRVILPTAFPRMGAPAGPYLCSLRSFTAMDAPGTCRQWGSTEWVERS